MTRQDELISPWTAGSFLWKVEMGGRSSSGKDAGLGVRRSELKTSSALPLLCNPGQGRLLGLFPQVS